MNISLVKEDKEPIEMKDKNMWSSTIPLSALTHCWVSPAVNKSIIT